MPTYTKKDAVEGVPEFLSTLRQDETILRVYYKPTERAPRIDFGIYTGTNGTLGQCLKIKTHETVTKEIPFPDISRLEVTPLIWCIDVLNRILNGETTIAGNMVLDFMD